MLSRSTGKGEHARELSLFGRDIFISWRLDVPLCQATLALEDGDEEEESAFEVSESELAISDESSEESDFDENASEEMSDEGSGSDEFSEGESWDELDKKAARKDKEAREAGGGGSEDEGKAKKRKR